MLSFSSPYFCVHGLNSKTDYVNLHFQSDYRLKILTRKTLYLDTRNSLQNSHDRKLDEIMVVYAVSPCSKKQAWEENFLPWKCFQITKEHKSIMMKNIDWLQFTEQQECKISKFHRISWFVKMHSFRRVSGNCVFIKFSHQKIICEIAVFYAVNRYNIVLRKNWMCLRVVWIRYSLQYIPKASSRFYKSPKYIAIGLARHLASKMLYFAVKIVKK